MHLMIRLNRMQRAQMLQLQRQHRQEPRDVIPVN
jgi:hypothetical protein